MRHLANRRLLLRRMLRMKKAVALSGIVNFDILDTLNHSYAMRLPESGCHLYNVQELLGHLAGRMKR